MKNKLISNGDDYQILFTAHKNKKLFIEKLSKSLKIRITKIGNILKNIDSSVILNENNHKGIKSQFFEGQRVTNKETIDVVEMVLGGK